MKYGIVLDFETTYYLEKEEDGFTRITLENCKEFGIPKSDVNFLKKKMKCDLYANKEDSDFKIGYVICKYFEDNDFF